ncbi:MAG: hypothetical protein QG635_593 [Bacteroidota bacterium]|nr:hypothetical protein [Bacteroidota bacterium]
MVNCLSVFRMFSRGSGDPEAPANPVKLKMAFPQLATALKDVESHYLNWQAMEKFFGVKGLLS